MRAFWIMCGIVLLAGCAHAPWAPAPQPPQVSFRSLIGELTNLDALADFPDPPFRTLRASSRDPRSSSPADATVTGWFANHDEGNYLRREENGGRREYVLMESQRPGAVTRIWAARPEAAGTVRFYFDGAAGPAIAMPLTDLLGGDRAPFLAPLAGEDNCLMPVPFAKSCRITVDSPAFEYQIDYREYEPGVRLPTFAQGLLDANADELEAIRARLGRPNTLAPLVSGRLRTQRYDARLAPGAVWELPVTGWHEAICRLTCRAESADMARALRGVTVEIFFDGHKEPDVVAPLGDFFGAAPGAAPFRTLTMGLFEDGTMYSHWVMPYAWRAKLRFTNCASIPVALTGEIVTAPRPRTRDTLYFRAKWRAAFAEPSRPVRDWTLLRAFGRGRLAGLGLAVANPTAQWWGDGDDKIYADSMSMPALWGTSASGAFGFAPEPVRPAGGVDRALGVDPARAPAGLTAMTRVMLTDGVPFEEGARADFEFYPRDPAAKIDWSAMAYWYGAAKGRDTFAQLSPGQLRPPSAAD